MRTKETKHTPGPWTIKAGTYKRARKEERRASIVMAGSMDDDSYRRVADCRDEDRWELDVDEANARLIAAAPELFELLGSLENDDGSIPEGIWKRIQAAIAKVEGEPTRRPDFMRVQPNSDALVLVPEEKP